MEPNIQEKKWQSQFGNDYVGRNDFDAEGLDNLYMKHFDIKRTDLNKEFLSGINKDIKILEVGCSTGMQLMALKKMGFKNFVGFDISKSGLKRAKENLPEATFMEASALDIPFKDNYFDLVFTAGVLIHQHPEKALGKVIDEIYRTTKKYIWVYEYFSEKCQEIKRYEGHNEVLWKNNFLRLFLERHPDLKVLKEKKLKYKDSDNVDHMFLLEKA